jgi:ABC-type transporter Mla subunit MlaD
MPASILDMPRLLAVPILALAIVATGCGGGGGSSSGGSGTGRESAATPAEDWANSVCQAFVDWNDSISAAGQGISQNPTEDGIRTAGDDIQSATDTLVEDLRGFGRPDTESGQQAKDAIDQLATSLDTSLQKINDAMDNASGTSGAVNAASTIANTLVEMGQEVSTAFTKLEDIDAQGELEDAFTSADSCAGLTTTS